MINWEKISEKLCVRDVYPSFNINFVLYDL